MGDFGSAGDQQSLKLTAVFLVRNDTLDVLEKSIMGRFGDR